MKNHHIRRSLNCLALIGLPLLGTLAQAAPTLSAGYTSALVATLPSSYGNYYGDIAVDGAGNRYVTGSFTQTIIKVDAAGAVSQYVNPNAGAALLGITVAGNDLYVASDNAQLTRVDLSTGAQTTLAATPGGTAPALAYGAGKLFVGTYSGLRAYDTASNSYTSVAGLNSLYNSLTFANDGRLLLSDYNNSRILAYDPVTNSSSVFRSGIANVGGIAVHAGSGKVYAAAEGNRQLFEIAADGSSASVFANNFDVDGGWYPTALTFSQDQSQLFFLQNAGSTFALHAISGFEAVVGQAVPEPGALALALLGLTGVALSRRRKSAHA